MTLEKPLPVGSFSFDPTIQITVGEAVLTDYFNKDHPKVVEYVKELKDQINELQQKNDLLEMDLTAAQEIMGCMNQEKAELIKALNYIRSCDNATQSAAKAIEMLKKYENV